MRCNKCGIDREQKDFWYRKARKKFVTICRICRNNRSKEIRESLTEKDKEEFRLKTRQHYAKNKEEITRKKRENYWGNREYKLNKAREKPSYKVVKPISMKKWQEKNKHKIHAHGKVYWAVKTGKLIRPERCQMCSKTGKTSAHHHDYEKALDVIWLCCECHARIHSKHFKEG